MPRVTRRSTREKKASSSSSTSLSLSSKSSAMGTQPSPAADDDDDDDKEEEDDMWMEWMQHSTFDYHRFDAETASQIRASLLTWYRQHRRKLPWRGDPPPYDGSTAGINNIQTGNRKEKKATQATQAMIQSNKITTFLVPTKKKKTTKETKAVRTNSKESSFILPHPPDIVPSSSSPQVSSAPGIPIPVSAYGIWVSEIMLQQTRVETVIPYWIRWMTTFPTVQDLAEASDEVVNAHWAGLGFYRRAKLLQQGARAVVVDHNGTVPTTVDELIRLPGIGRYTASAIASIAHDVCVPVVDGNVCRVLCRLTGIANHIKAPAVKDKYGWELATTIVEAGDGSCAGEVNQAMMELGATYCAPSGTGIDPRDPLREYYRSTKLGYAYHQWRRKRQQRQRKRQQQPSIPALSSLLPPPKCDCPVCDTDGIHSVWEALETTMNLGNIADPAADMADDDNDDDDEAYQAGHKAFPLDPPKSKRREEDWSVAVICNRPIPTNSDADDNNTTTKPDDDDDDDVWWLLIRRPNKGLLAGQWEFPSVCVERRIEGQTKPPTPGAAVRRETLTKFLNSIMAEQKPQQQQQQQQKTKKKQSSSSSWWDAATHETGRTGIGPSPLEHIFSHIKHNMYLEWLALQIELPTLEWTTVEGRQVRWMRERDMDRVGITSGVKKILKTVKSEIGNPEGKTEKKRKR